MAQEMPPDPVAVPDISRSRFGQAVVRAGVKLFFMAGLLFVFWLPRGLELDRFVTVDEAKWLLRSANFFQALSQADFQNTYQKEHPGVTITWAGTAGFLWRYPDYVRQGPGQMARPAKLLTFLRNRQVSSLELLQAGRFFVVLGIVAVLGLSFLQAAQLIGMAAAMLGFVLVAFDPFEIALSRLLHLDGLASALMLLSGLAFANYLYRGGRVTHLLLSAVAAGLSWLTKSPAFFLIPFAGLLALVEALRGWKRQRPDVLLLHRPEVLPLRQLILAILGWGLLAGLVFVLLWPAMWVHPMETIRQVLSQASAYTVTGHESATFFNGRIYSGGQSAWYFYPLSYWWRATPPVLVGLGLAILALLARGKLALSARQRQMIGVFLAFAVLYTLFMSLSAKKFDRYLLPVYAPLSLAAGMGWVWLVESVQKYWNSRPLRRAARLSLAVIIVLVGLGQATAGMPSFPYYFSYYNPLAGGLSRAPEVMMIGWGEGLDQAASYLNGLPGANRLRVMSWYGEGSFSYLFKGQTVEMDLDTTIESLRNIDYVVLYVNQFQRQLPNPELLAYFSGQTPAFVAQIEGLDYAWVYALETAPDPAE